MKRIAGISMLAGTLLAQESGVLSWHLLVPSKRSVDLRGVDMAQAYDYLNRLRQKAGMIPLKVSKTLELAARNHSRYMVQNNLTGHGEREGDPGFSGVNPWNRAIGVGYPSRMVSENISYGDTTPKESIDSLMSAIYHRFGFLDEYIDEIGAGYAQSSSYYYHNAYTYDMGSSKLAYLCSDGYEGFSGYGRYVYGICADYDKRIGEEAFNQALQSVARRNDTIVVWPYRDATDIPPVFYEERPDPLPECSVSGYPVSVKFNAYRIDGVPQMLGFELYDGARRIDETLTMTKRSDPNGRLSEYEFAIFPLRRLEWDHTYSAVFRYELGGELHTLRWRFHTRALPYPMYEVTQESETLPILPNKRYALYFPPKNCNDRLERVSYRYTSTIRRVDLAYYDLNTLLLSVEGDRGYVELSIGGRKVRLELADVDGFTQESSQSSSSLSSSNSSTSSSSSASTLSSFGSSSSVGDVESIVASVAGKTYEIAGYFAYYGEGDPYAWIYLNRSGDLLAKLEGLNEGGYLKWRLLMEDFATFRFDGSNIVLGVARRDTPIARTLQKRSIPLSGYFIYYGQGDPFDWIYIDRDFKLIAKLEGLDNSGLFRWMRLEKALEAYKLEDRIFFMRRR